MYNEGTVGAPFLIGDIVALAEFIQRFPIQYTLRNATLHTVSCGIRQWGGGVDPPEEELTP